MAKLIRQGGCIWIDTPQGRVLIEPSHQDRRRSRYWRGRLARRVLSAWLPTPVLAALASLRKLT